MLLTLKRNGVFVVATCVAFTICVFALAVNAQQGDKKAKRVTVTGCLQKGDDSEEFALHDDNGKNYELISGAIKLAGHAGHKVSVTGTVIEDEDEESEMQEQSDDRPVRIRVISLRMISEACK